MMLLYKAWLESRTRFLLSAIAIAGLSAAFVFFHQDVRAALIDHDVTYTEYIWEGIFKGHIRDLYVVLALMLGMGGLERERANGTSGYTLTLPISRLRFIAVRGVAGVFQIALLSFLPAILVPALSPLVHEIYPWAHSLKFGLLWTIGGVCIFAIGFLASVLFSGEYSAPITAIGFLFAYSITTDLPGMERYIVDIHDTMNGSGPHGFVTLAMILFTSSVVIGLAGYITTKKDY